MKTTAILTVLSFLSIIRLSAGEPAVVSSPPSGFQGIREAHEVWRHRFEADADGPGFLARNPGQRWTTVFDRRGFTVRPDDGGWEWGLELRGYGCSSGSRSAIASAPEVSVTTSRLAYRWDAVMEEWFLNDRRGLEQGWTLVERPQGAPEDRLTLDFTIRGSLKPDVPESGSEVHFLNGTGETVVDYGGLKAWDAGGTSLPVAFESHGDGLRIVIDERGARYPVTIDPIARQAYLKASNPDASDGFGSAIAVSGDTVVVGAPFEAGNSPGVNGDASNDDAGGAGAAYVFVRKNGSWQQEAYLKAEYPHVGSYFGTSVAVSGDTVIVGAPYERGMATGVNGDGSDVAGNSDLRTGAAYVFVRDGNGTWSQQAYLKASNTGEGDEFGSSVSISGDTAVVGAPYEDSDAEGSGGDQSDNTAGDAGAVYVFVRQNTIWSQEAYLKASNSDPGDYFGYSVSASGETIAVGAIAEASAATGINGDDEDNNRFLAGAVYLFTRAAGNWSQHTYLKASNAGSSDEFGFSVCLSGNDLIVGAPYERSLASGVGGDESDNSGSEPGAAYIYARDGNGNWSQQAYLKATVNDGGDDRFGWTVGISGNHAVVSTPFEDTRGGDAGAVYVFSKSGGVWTTNETLFGGETETGDQFGRCVAIDGTLIVAGASGEDGGGAGIDADETSNTASASGAAYLFVLPAPNAPGLRISGPKTIKTSRSRHSLRGTAADADGDLLRVEVLDQRPRGGRMLRPASGAAVWSFTAPLKPGRNRIEARAMDQGGRFSPKVRITVIRK